MAYSRYLQISGVGNRKEVFGGVGSWREYTADKGVKEKGRNRVKFPGRGELMKKGWAKEGIQHQGTHEPCVLKGSWRKKRCSWSQRRPETGEAQPSSRGAEPPGGNWSVRGGDWQDGPPITAPYFLASPGNPQALGRGRGIAATAAPALRETAGREGGS